MKRKDPNQYPSGWNAQRVQKIAEYYDSQTDDEIAAEFEAFHRRADELRRQNLPEEEIDKILTEEADELSSIGTPKQRHKRLTTFELSPDWLEKAKQLAAAHQFSDYRHWIAQIVKERLQLEHQLYQSLQKETKRNQGTKRRISRARA